MHRYLLHILLSCVFLVSYIRAKPSDSKDWFAYAENDLQAASVLTDAHIIGCALYHIEQASEKALKAYLIATNTSFALTHDLVPLLGSCCKTEPDFDQFASDIRDINPYSTKSRYPNKSYIEPAPNTVKSLIARATALLHFVRNKIISAA